MKRAVIIDAVRTPVAKGKASGAYSEIHPVDLHAHSIRALIERTGIDPAQVDDVISGVVGQVGETIPSQLYQAVAEILAVVYRTHRFYFHQLKTRRLASNAA